MCYVQKNFISLARMIALRAARERVDETNGIVDQSGGHEANMVTEFSAQVKLILVSFFQENKNLEKKTAENDISSFHVFLCFVLFCLSHRLFLYLGFVLFGLFVCCLLFCFVCLFVVCCLLFVVLFCFVLFLFCLF